MVQRKVWSLATVAGLVVAGAALAGCGSGGRSAAGSGSGPTTTSGAVTSTTAATGPSTIPTSTVPTSTTISPAPGTTFPAPATSPTTTGGRPNGGPVLIVRSFDGTISYDGQRPATIGISRDSTNIVSRLTWSSWGPATAVGHGVVGINNCDPNCATGTVTEVPATIGLGTVANGHFTTMTERAASLLHTYSYPSNWAASAS